MSNKQVVFTHIYECIEQGKPISTGYLQLAQHHGIRIEAVKETVQSLKEDDCDDE